MPSIPPSNQPRPSKLPTAALSAADSSSVPQAGSKGKAKADAAVKATAAESATAKALQNAAARDAGPGPATVGGKPIEVKWSTGRAYSYRADDFPDRHSMLDHPQGWKPYHGLTTRPARRESVRRETATDSADASGEGVLQRKYELKHYLAEFGAAAVQAQLSCLPRMSRRPTGEELFVMQDFSKAVHQYTRLSQGKRGPSHGEFIATYFRHTDADSGEVELRRSNFKYNAAHSIDVPQKGAPHDFVIHSHPYDPKHPLAAGVSEPLGGAYPSGQDRLMARTAGKGGRTAAVELMMHGGQVFHIHADDLHFSLLDPAAGTTLHLADKRNGPGWDQDLFLTPHPTPPTELPKS